MDDVMDEQKHLHRTQQRLCQEKNRNERATSNAQNMWARWKSNILVLLSSRRPTLLVERFWLRCVYAAIAVRYTFFLQWHTQHTHIKRGAPRKKRWNGILFDIKGRMKRMKVYSELTNCVHKYNTRTSTSRRTQNTKIKRCHEIFNTFFFISVCRSENSNESYVGLCMHSEWKEVEPEVFWSGTSHFAPFFLGETHRRQESIE